MSTGRDDDPTRITTVPDEIKVLVYALSVGTTHVGDHAQYMDGRSLYPGFEPDEAATFLVGLGTHLSCMGIPTSTSLRHPRYWKG